MLTTQRATPNGTTSGLTGTHYAASRLCAAWQWLGMQRRNTHEGADVWDIRWQAVHARVPYCLRWNIWSKMVLVIFITAIAGLSPSTQAVEPATFNWTGFPSTIPAGLQAGDIIGPGGLNISYTASLPSDWGTNTVKYLGFSAEGGCKGFESTCGKAGGHAFVQPFAKCQTVVFMPTSIGYNTNGKYSPASGTVQMVADRIYGYQTAKANRANLSFTVNGYWIAGVDNPTQGCNVSGRNTRLLIGFGDTLNGDNGGYEYPGGSCEASPGPYCLKQGTGGTLPPSPVERASCSISASPVTVDFGDGRGSASGAIELNDIAKAPNVTIAAITPTPLTVNTSCSGGSGLAKIHGNVTWTNPYNGWSAGFHGGVPINGDDSAPLILATNMVTVGQKYTPGMFDTTSPLQFGDNFLLTPGVPKTLYPALLRTQTTTVTSGLHTISGTLKVVVD